MGDLVFVGKLSEQGARETREDGKKFGYPDCCVDWFIKVWREGYSPGEVCGFGQWTGTGYIPCPTCAEQIIMGEYE